MTAAPARLDPGDPQTLRHVLGHYPSGVVAITSTDADTGIPVGLVASSFTSVSLDPPLVAFFPQKTSTTWPRIRRRRAFGVDVLDARQQEVCGRLAAKGGDKFAAIPWTTDRLGLPSITGAVAHITCDLESVHDAGDHEIAVGRVRELSIGPSATPMLFFRGGFGAVPPPGPEGRS
ncbi:flavin reductase family protein [Gordonia sp. DT30]|uniref:flavin reductase family protein n=1 Tax=unclassified Gordonia (in: high G+C Gram-positive bacteria) TaxID=2657482 RepID=UPI003CE7DC48